MKTLEKIIKKDRKERPIDNKFLYIRALECKDAINKIFREVTKITN